MKLTPMSGADVRAIAEFTDLPPATVRQIVNLAEQRCRRAVEEWIEQRQGPTTP